MLETYTSLKTPDALYSKALNFVVPNMTISNIDFENFLMGIEIKSLNNSLIYLDPPYLTTQFYYGKNGSLHKDFRHATLACILQEKFKDHNWMLCYNDCVEIRKLYSWCKIVPVEWSHGMSHNKHANYNKEILILSKSLAR
jgi:DNA adenine methylase